MPAYKSPAFQHDRQKQKTPIKLLLVMQSVAFAITYIALINLPSSGIDPSQLIYPISCIALVVTIWMLWTWWQATGSTFDPYLLFLLSAIFFSLGQAVLEIFGLNPYGLLKGLVSAETLVFALMLAIASLNGMHLGALFALYTKRVNYTNVQVVPSNNVQALRAIGWILLGISIVPTTLGSVQSISVVSSGGYFALYQQEANIGLLAGPQILAGFFVPSILFLLAGHGGSNFYVILTSILIAAPSAIALMLGGRYGAIAPLIAYAWVLHKCWRPLPTRLLLSIGLVFLVIIFPTIGSIRNSALIERSSLESIAGSYFSLENPSFSTFSEMGGTLLTVAYTIDLIPSTRPFDYGLQYLYSLLTIFPSIGDSLHPTVVRGTPTAWLITAVDPFTAARGGSLGYSFIAEAYMNFDYWGAPFILCVIGFLFVRFALWADLSDDPARVATVASYLAFFLVFARADSTGLVRPLFWYALAPYIAVLALKRKI